MKVEFSDEANLEVEATFDYLAEQVSVETAAAFLDAIDQARAAIQDGPHRWAIQRGGWRRYLIDRFKYQLISRMEGETVRVYACAHQRRQPGYWRMRLQQPR